MRRLSFLFRPGWLALGAVVAVFAVMCFTVLAPWQLGKNTTTSHRNTLITDSVKSTPVPLAQVLNGKTVAPSGDEWRRVTVGGHYLPDKQVLERLRVIDDNPAYLVLAPFALDGGEGTILVNRGYVRPVQGTQPPAVAAPPAGHVTLQARIRAAEPVDPGRSPVTEAGWQQVYSIDPTQVGQITGLPLLGDYLQLEADQPGGLGVIALPQLDSGPYLSYGLQWLAFGIMAPLGLAYFVRAELRERKRRRQQQQEIDALTAGDAVPADPPSDGPAAGEKTAPVEDPAPAENIATPAAAATPADDLDHVLRGRRRRSHADAPALTATQAKLADRYGDRR
ncbi:SURF1 family protein [Rhodococcus sp. D2-41]|uniref:SURF1-like protein n=1 Tax=Speluncibacter jeojiensis TaxID=2710754 RepID=A0A9X4LY20_9ACTN|nr:SURF1 family cytochrome oxidase biogenesis protein [Rhodococcus sp. D2-41]MDG3011898.1 SURF1 family protein [Rhodococcus sp. D2-41]MDG3013349.1 SURF1 family protein [Corynebacteriales bacterium D3-21]